MNPDQFGQGLAQQAGLGQPGGGAAAPAQDPSQMLMQQIATDVQDIKAMLGQMLGGGQGGGQAVPPPPPPAAPLG